MVKSEPDENLEHKLIETQNGKVRGVRKTSLFKNIDYYSFKGIPYAKSPIGKLRFKVSFCEKKSLKKNEAIEM